MGDVPLAFVETVGGVRVSEDDAVAVGKNDVSIGCGMEGSPLMCAIRFCPSRSVEHDLRVSWSKSCEGYVASQQHLALI